MLFTEKLPSVQSTLGLQKLDGWLLYDFRRSNEIACQFLEIPAENLITRRFFYWIPVKGAPVKIVHAIEANQLNHLPGKVLSYATWQELEGHLEKTLENSHYIAMEYSARNAIPYVSKVDAGTMDIIRGLGVSVTSSAEIVQVYTSVWSEYQLGTHLAAAEVLSSTVDKAWKFIAKHLIEQRKLTEYNVQQFILEQFAQHDCLTSDSPICAVNANSANPHYVAKAESALEIKKGDFILIDLWCKQNLPHAVYADITRVGVAASQPTSFQKEIFDIVKQAQASAVALIEGRLQQDLACMGYEVDDACRKVIEEAGYGKNFIHRTGHNIGESDHGNGTHIDNFETHDCRKILPGTCFSIEPGIYLPDQFGIRLEYDVYIHLDKHLQITGGAQEAIKCIFAN